MKSGIYRVLVVLVIILLVVGGCRKAGVWLKKEDPPTHADVMVILTGGIADRVLQAADLYREGEADRVWIVEEAMGANRALDERGIHLISNTTQACNALKALGIPARNILVLPGDANSTIMEARIVRSYMEDRLSPRAGIDTLLLVSSASHTRRAYKIFSAALQSLGTPVVIHCSPSIYTNFNAKKWWKNREDVQRVFEEYYKIVIFGIFEKRELRKSGSQKKDAPPKGAP